MLLPSETHAQDPSNAGRTRTYYVAADEVEWEYLWPVPERAGPGPVQGSSVIALQGRIARR